MRPHLGIKSGWPIVLASQPSEWDFVVRGVGYVLSTFASYVFANPDLVAGLLLVPSIIGELWMIAYLIVFGVREHARPEPDSARVAA